MSLGWRPESCLTHPSVSGLQSHTAGGVCAARPRGCASEVLNRSCTLELWSILTVTSVALGYIHISAEEVTVQPSAVGQGPGRTSRQKMHHDINSGAASSRTYCLHAADNALLWQLFAALCPEGSPPIIAFATAVLILIAVVAAAVVLPGPLL